jgi:AAA15 family ATPase/GTPase
MLKDIHIKNYRGIKDLKIKDFKRINLLVGDNNSGKTSVLEAVGMSVNYDASFVIACEGIREAGMLPQITHLQDPKMWTDFEYLFYEKSFQEGFEISSTVIKENLEKIIKLKASLTNDSGKFSNSHVLNSFVINQNLINSLILEYSGNDLNQERLGYSRDGTYSALSNTIPITPLSFISSVPVKTRELIDPMGKVAQDNGEKFFSDLAQKIDPKIKAIKTSGNQILADIGKVSVPLKYMGDGITNVIHVLLQIREKKNGILLIDEIENGLHWKTQRILWKAVIKAAEDNNVQIIATTHSNEIIYALSKAYEEINLLEEDEIRIFKIKKDSQENNHALKYNSGMIKHVVEDEAEVR